MNGIVDEALIGLALMLLFDVLKTTPLFDAETPKRYIPLMAMGLGIAAYLVWAYVAGQVSGMTLLYSVLSGIIAGAAATGFHETGVPDRVYTRVSR